MSNRYKGGIISATPPTTTGGNDGVASGAWTLEQQYQAQGAGVWPNQPNFGIEDVFSTYLYTGNSSASGQTITNGIDLAGKGGLVWQKNRSSAIKHWLYDSAQSGGLVTNAIDAAYTANDDVDFTSSGFVTKYLSGNVNLSGATYVSWTFRKQPKFFDVITYTGNGSTFKTISHSLGSVPGCIIVKKTNNTSDWWVRHRSQTNIGRLNLTNTFDQNSDIITNLTSTTFDVGVPAGGANTNGDTYVAYLFAHDAGGFGPAGTDNVISCGSVDTGASGTSGTVNLGWEPQFVIMKRTNGVENWMQFDNMRGLGALYAANKLNPNTTGAEQGPGADEIQISSTGLTIANVGTNAQFIYIAIRRGPMRAPTSGASVFSSVSATPSGATNVTTNFPVDLAINAQRDSAVSGNKVFWDRLRGSSAASGKGLFSNLTNAEVSYASNGIGLQSNTTIVDNYWNTLNGATTPVIYWNLRRAPRFFDIVCYSGNSTAGRTINHNLGVVPELIIQRPRNYAPVNWQVYSSSLGIDNRLVLDGTDPSSSGYGTLVFNNTAPTSSVITLGSWGVWNGTGYNHVAYLFATCPGVSKVGSYTGNGTTQTINCGFTGGARFILIKSVSAAGNWRVYDTTRGIVAGNEPEVFLNLTAAEQTVYDAIDPDSTGFIVNTNSANVNDNGVSYIFLAIA